MHGLLQTPKQPPKSASEGDTQTPPPEVEDANFALWGIISNGSTAFVSRHGPDRVLKGCVVYRDGKEGAFMGNQEECEKSLRREVEVYEVLESRPHPHILRYYGLVEVTAGKHSLCLEYATLGSLRTFIDNSALKPPNERQRLKWAVDVASAVSHLHSCNIYHCDISCQNILLDAAGEVKLADFGGSRLPGQEPLSAAEGRYQLPCRGREWSEMPVLKEEIFALGCTIYEISAWQAPHANVEDLYVDELYEAGRFPAVDGLLTAGIIEKCWQEQYDSAADVEKDLKALQSSHAGGGDKFGEHAQVCLYLTASLFRAISKRNKPCEIIPSNLSRASVVARQP